MNLIDQQCFDGFAMSKSEAITKILGTLDRITMETTISANDNNGCLVMTRNENNNNYNNNNGTPTTTITANTTTSTPSKPRPETPINQSRSSVNKSATTSSREGGCSSKEESSKRSSKRSTNWTDCGALMDCKLTKVNTKLDTINASVCHFTSEFKSLKMLMERQEKMHRITFAIENCDFGSFEYYNSLTFCHHQSHHLVKSILFAFRQENGFFELPTECIIEESDGLLFRHQADEKNMAKGERLFHESLVNQIHALTGIEPRIEKIAGNAIIWYS